MCTVCAQQLRVVDPALWRCLGASACRGGAVLFMLQGLPRMHTLQCCGQQEKHSWHLNNRHSFLELAPLLEIEKPIVF